MGNKIKYIWKYNQGGTKRRIEDNKYWGQVAPHSQKVSILYHRKIKPEQYSIKL